MSENIDGFDEVDRIIYRAISKEELEDIYLNGLRNIPGAYEIVKLFALKHEDAFSYGLLNQKFDNKLFWVIAVSIPYIIFLSSDILHTDGIRNGYRKKYLTLLKFIEVNYKPE